MVEDEEKLKKKKQHFSEDRVGKWVGFCKGNLEIWGRRAEIAAEYKWACESLMTGERIEHMKEYLQGLDGVPDELVEYLEEDSSIAIVIIEEITKGIDTSNIDEQLEEKIDELRFAYEEWEAELLYAHTLQEDIKEGTHSDKDEIEI